MRGLYVHLPFCLKKCDYCDFVSYTDCFSKEEAYVDALLLEFSKYRGTKIDTIYLGGGTPTTLQTKSLVRILDGAFQAFDVEKNAEITVECNPKTAEKDTFLKLFNSGVNRLSIGIQSLDDTILKTIGRIHTVEDAISCVMEAHDAGFRNINADLMFALPGQTLECLTETIDKMVKLPLTHISCYGLILEEGTPMFQKVSSGAYALPGEDMECAMYEAVYEQLEKHGFYRYEISNFSKPGFASRHNLKYWDCEEYIGCGCGAHSYFQKKRYCHTTDLTEYLRNPVEMSDVVEVRQEDAIKEYMMLGLRKTAGVSKSAFYEKFGISLSERFGDIIEKYKAGGFLQETKDTLSFTEKGIYVSNTVLCEFV